MKQDPLEIFRETGALLHGHFVLTAGGHTDQYLNKDDLYPYTALTSALCEQIALFSDDSIETVVAPEKGGIILSQWVAHHLTQLLGRNIFAVYAEKDKEGGFVFNRRYDRFVSEKRVLVVEDVITTGGSVETVLYAARALRATVVGVGVLCNRSGMAASTLAQQFSVPWVRTLTDIPMSSWDETACLLCRDGIRINTEVGKGAEFLASRS